jgi:hypothetical protein
MPQPVPVAQGQPSPLVVTIITDKGYCQQTSDGQFGCKALAQPSPITAQGPIVLFAGTTCRIFNKPTRGRDKEGKEVIVEPENLQCEAMQNVEKKEEPTK